jgi:hypothetical protein
LVDASTGTVDTLEAAETSPSNVVERLRSAGAEPKDLRAVEGALRPATGEPNPTARLVLAESGEVRLDELLVGDEAQPDLATVGPVPDLLPLLRYRQHRFPYLVVDARRDGGEVSAHTVTGRREGQTEVAGSRENLTKNPRGGRSQGRYQYRTEEVWRRNAAELGDVVEEARRAGDARLIIVLGDAHAAQLLIDQLPAAAADLAVRIDHIPDGAAQDDQVVRQRVEELIAERYAEAEQALVGRLREAQGQPEPAAATGLESVVEALQQARADVVVLTDPAEDRRLTVLDSEPWVALPGDESYGSQVLGEADATAALLRAAALTDARVALLPPGALRAEGSGSTEIAALLRWSAAAQS